MTDDRHAEHTEQPSAAEIWDARYAESTRIWSGKPNVTLVRETSDLPPGRALDVGCGEGGDAIWLAKRGWRVTAIDVSRIALERAAEHAKEEQVADLIDWQWHDLGATFPAGSFDLVSAHFLHSHGELDRDAILRTAATRVAPGGVLLIVGHSGVAPWEKDKHPGVVLPTPAEVLAALELPVAQWAVLRNEEHERIQNDPEGRPTTRTDNTLMVRRLAD
ncbi:MULTISPECIES: class I SAM-dependent methyltransferase [unclassified Embleya]|uniref:class I SAM-dependent methyltransferase n=1 Tax=unclassified Embleya TaxID=2699296 RepID=UPI0033F3B608